VIGVVAGHVGIERLRLDGLCPDKDPEQLRRQTGTRGEREWTGDIAQRIVRAFQGRGLDAFAADASGGDEIRAPLDLLINVHYQRDSSTSRAFCGIPSDRYISADARAESSRWQALFNARYTDITGIPVTPERGEGGNLTENYLWCYVGAETPCVLIECGNADLDAATLYEPDIARVVGAVVVLTLAWRGAPTPPPPVPTPVPAVVTVLGSPSPLSLVELVRGMWRQNPLAPFEILRLYAALAPLAGIRTDVAVAQAAKETGWWTFTRIARPEWNNYAGIGCSEATRRCDIFASPELGIRAHLGHLLAYFGEHDPPFCDTDPRHDLVGHRHLPNDITALGGGNWAPASDYGQKIAATLLKLSP
jgi:hypothetical protein